VKGALMPGTRGKYGRVLLKLSGEVFGGEKGIGVDPDVVQDVAKQLPKARTEQTKLVLIYQRKVPRE